MKLKPIENTVQIAEGLILRILLGIYLVAAAASVAHAQDQKDNGRSRFTSRRTTHDLQPNRFDRSDSYSSQDPEFFLGKPLSEITVDINQPESVMSGSRQPANRAAQLFSEVPAIIETTTEIPRFVDVMSETSEFCHLPLYFEEEKLERHGHSVGILQPALSAAHFFATIPTIPYKLVVEPPRQCAIYTYPYAAGRPAPPYHVGYPLSIDGGLFQAGVIIGLVALIP